MAGFPFLAGCDNRANDSIRGEENFLAERYSKPRNDPTQRSANHGPHMNDDFSIFNAPRPSQIGGRLPLTCTAVGKALLAPESKSVQQDVLARPLRRFTPHSITDPKVLSLELDSIRRTGVALEREEAALGGCCLASPVMVNKKPIAALSVSVPKAQFKPELLAPAVRTAALALGRVLTRTSPDTPA